MLIFEYLKLFEKGNFQPKDARDLRKIKRDKQRKKSNIRKKMR